MEMFSFRDCDSGQFWSAAAAAGGAQPVLGSEQAPPFLLILMLVKSKRPRTDCGPAGPAVSNAQPAMITIKLISALKH